MNTNLNVLVLEDNPAYMRLVQELLKDSTLKQFELINATSLSQASDFIKNQTIDIILLDLGLPEVQGIETFREVNKIAFNIPIIILTALEDETVAITTIAEGAQDYFVKGKFTGNQLGRAIGYAIKRKHNENVIDEYAEIIKNTSEAIFSLTLDGMINNWNSAAETIYLYPANEIIGKSFLNLFVSENKRDAERMFNSVISDNNIIRYEINLMDKLGNKVDSLLTVSPIKNKLGIIIGASVLAQDYSDQKHLEQQSAIQLRVATILSESSSIHHAAQGILKAICEILNFQAGEIWADDPKENELRCVSIWTKHNVPIEFLQERKDLVLHKGEGIPGIIWESKKPYWTKDIGEEKRSILREMLMKMGLNCCIGFPVLFHEETLGAFLFFGHDVEMLDVGSMIIFELIGKQIGHFFKRKRVESSIFYLAQHDVLTGLANKVVAEDALKNAIFQAKKNEKMVAFLYFDLDHFKNINDTLGHQKGDLVLQEVGHRLEKIVRETDLVARFGGDEFAVILSEVHSKEDVDLVAKKILTTIASPYRIDEKEFYLTASIGVSLYPADGDDVSGLLRAADFAMYQAKDIGRNSYQYSSPEQEKIQQKKVMMEASLHQALEQNEFILYYQPIVEVQTNKIISVEALLRWKNADGNIVSPAEFIPLLERSDLILRVGEWVLRTACKQMKAWNQSGFHSVSVNVSVHQVSHRFISLIQNIIEETGIVPSNLVLEVTESILMKRTELMLKIIQSLNEMGIVLSLDDFGTGYSSFSYLKNFTIHYLKIDKSFVTGVDKNENSASITEAIIAMAHALKMKAIAEGVETKEELDFLKAKGCDQYQGYYFSKPLLPDELSKLFNKN
ncbi:MAG: EAL domain-containing protein [Gammaproteobacteria bacterium]|nr:EAL domain-containing protein [Gammaproteobacteria bacterium]